MKRRVMAGVVLAVGVVLFFWKPWVSKKRGPAYQESVVESGPLRVSLLVTGVALPQNRLEIKPPIAGRVENVLVQEGQRVKKGEILLWMSSSERAALLDAARAKGPEELSHWETLYKPAPLVAPLNGVVIARAVEPGQSVTGQDAVLVMSDRLIVKAPVDETDIGRVTVGQRGVITLDAHPEQPILARVDHVAYEAKTVSNVTTYEVDIVPEKVPSLMRSGMTASVDLVVAERREVPWVVSEAIVFRESKKFLRAPGAEGPREVMITTGLDDGRRVEILSGASVGDRYLVERTNLSDKKSGGTNPFMPRRPTNRSRPTGAPRTP